ncbi:MAG: hypothetical protein KKA73_00680 [Chloroflexi bacterium]|nr:hypothetical protein [Chloroflexota bacterium]
MNQDLGPLFANLHNPPLPPTRTLTDLRQRPGWASLDPYAQTVAEHLFQQAQGAARAQTARAIVQAVGTGSPRHVRAATEALSEAGYGEVCSSTHRPWGYFWATSADEVARYQIQLKSRLQRLHVRLRAANQAQQRLAMTEAA